VESGKHDDRPKLAEALALCLLRNTTLVIAKLDRLSRDALICLACRIVGVRGVADPLVALGRPILPCR